MAAVEGEDKVGEKRERTEEKEDEGVQKNRGGDEVAGGDGGQELKKAKTADEDGEPATAAAAAAAAAAEPVKVGPKVFKDADQMFKYFSALLSNQTLDQDINEVREWARILAQETHQSVTGVSGQENLKKRM